MNTITLSLTGKIVRFKLLGKLFVFAWGIENLPTTVTPVAKGNDAGQK